ncbi:ankyrin repeat domain-containing protein [Fusarium mexicanum]|uniref:Ankyrin repeat domain-containing protein n=1 Tax=Fusarium mexicanum TaxID=751941 RepID=A0A8H5J3L7_9HYPO|nr:ankyrin repeat domain-containing protein [Fusarium mexicanum]
MDDLTGLQLIAHGTSWTDRAIDIITIHGLQGYDTWENHTLGAGDSSKTVFWVRDFLPKDFPSARIFTYHYPTTAFRDGQGITRAAEKLLNKLKNLQADNIEVRLTSHYRTDLFPSLPVPRYRKSESVGGLILQCALGKAFDNKGDTALNEIITVTQGIIFLGTPHPSPELDISVSRIVAASQTTTSIMVDTQFMAQVLVSFASLSKYNPPWKVVHCYEELPLPGTSFRAVNPSQEESWALPQLSLYSHHLDLCRFGSQNDVSYIKVLQSLRNITSGLGSSVADETEVQTTLSSVEHEVLESLEAEDTSANIRDAYPGTYDWILNHNTYKSWFDKPFQPLYISGNPGSGKTILMKHILQAINLERTPSQSVASFFFHGGGENHSVASLLSSLLHQLLETTPAMRSFEVFSKFHQRREHEISDSVMDIDVLMESLLLLINKSTAQGHSIFFIIDALDECDDPAKLVTILCRLNDLNPSLKLRICISSRPSNLPIQGAEIRLEDNNLLDIQRYLGESLLVLKDYLLPASDIKQTAQVLAEKAKGIFLWASLSVSQLRCHSHLETPKFEQHSMSCLPATLYTAYETIIRQLWSRHDETRKQMARDAFTLVLCAQRPLSILELRSALAAMHYDPELLSPRSKTEVNDWGVRNKMNKIQDKTSLDMSTQLMLLCGGLLEVVPRQAKFANDTTYPQSTVQFVHQSVTEFLQERGSCILEGNNRISELSFPELKFTDLQAYNAQYHFRVARICLLYVDHTYMRANFLNTENTISSATFLEYSLWFGMAHLSLAERAGVNPMKEGIYHFFPSQEGFVDEWSLLHSRIFSDQKLFEPHKTTALHIMSYYGLPWFDTGFWGARLAEIHEEDHYGRTPLSLAAAMGHRHICEILLDNGADMSHRDYIYGQTPLSYAAAYGHREVVELLLSKGSDYDDRSSGVTPLWLAVRSGHLNIAELLLEAGADPNACSIHTGEACLSHAASLGHSQAAYLLLARGATVDTLDKNGWTPLHHAVSQGRKKIIELLLGVLKSQELLKLKKSLSQVKGKGSWIHTVLSAIVMLGCYQRGGEWQTPPVGNQNSRGLNQCSEGRLLTNRGINRQKHKLDAGKDEDRDEEDMRGNSEKRPRRSEPGGDRFACPYHKKNRARFSSGTCNGKGFENIDRLKSHLKRFHDLSTIMRRCHVCKRRFIRDELEGHSPCERNAFGDDYEDGYDVDQAQDLKSDPARPSKNTPESCWKAIFRVLFPDWPANVDTPNPYQANAVLDAIHQHCNRMRNQSTISQFLACQSGDQILQVLELLIEDFQSNLGHTTIASDNLLTRPVSAMPPQPTITAQYPQYQLPPVSQPNPFHTQHRRSQFHTPAVSSFDSNSSRFLHSHDQFDTLTEGTAFSDLMPTGFDSFVPHQGIDSSSALPQFQPQMALSVLQQPTGNINHHPGLTLATEGQGMASDDNWNDHSHNFEHPVREDLVQGDLQAKDYDENETLSIPPF